MLQRSAVVGLLFSAACLGSPEPEQRAGSQAEQGFSLDNPVVNLATDPRFVLRQVLDSWEEDVSAVAGEPFSHRSRMWHVYPFTAYPDVQPAVRLTVNDPRLAEGTSLWLFGPMRSDGGWDAPQRFDSVGGVVELARQSLVPGQYALVVGPGSADGFLPRYPSSLARLLDDTGRELVGQLDAPDDGTRPRLYLEDGRSFEVESPAPERPRQSAARSWRATRAAR